MTNFVADALSAYRKEVGTNQPAGQLLAPEALKLLPLYVNALMRHVGSQNFAAVALPTGRLVVEVLYGARVNTVFRCLFPHTYCAFSPRLRRHAQFPLTSAHVP